MQTIRDRSVVLIALAAALCLMPRSVAGQTDGKDATLREKALSLNDVTGEKPIRGEIQALADDPAGTKKLLAVAVLMAKEKEQPFTYNGAYILGNAALVVKNVDAAKLFFDVCAEEASTSQSARKLLKAFEGMRAVIAELYHDKKYAESDKLAQEFLEKLDKRRISEEYKAQVERQLCMSLAKEGRLDQANRIADNLIKVRKKDFMRHDLKGWLLNEGKKYGEAAKSFQKAFQLLEDDDRFDKDKKSSDQIRLGLEACEAYGKQGKLDEAAKFVAEAIKGHEEDWRRLELKAWLEKKQKKYDEVAKTYARMHELIQKDDTIDKEIKEPLLLDAQQLRLQALVRLGKYAEADAIYQSILKGRESNWRVLMLGASLEQDKGDFGKSVKTYEKVMKLIGNDKNLSPDERAKRQDTVRYILSGVYVDADQVDKAATQLKYLLDKEPDSPRYNNDLGYIWADHDMNIGQAERMIRKALDEDRKQRKLRGPSEDEEDEDNAAYLDSLGWVLFKQKKLDEAKKYLLEAVKHKDGQHIEIMDHLGDVYTALGDKSKAIETWKDALKLDTATFRERQKRVEVEKKLRATEQSAARTE
jgi:tetratricopeptide (TPR) repeat protein